MKTFELQKLVLGIVQKFLDFFEVSIGVEVSYSKQFLNVDLDQQPGPSLKLNATKKGKHPDGLIILLIENQDARIVNYELSLDGNSRFKLMSQNTLPFLFGVVINFIITLLLFYIFHRLFLPFFGS